MNGLPHRILIVEDEALVLEVIKGAFNSEKNRLFTAGTIEEAEAVLKAHGADLLILDRILPDGDGLQLCSKLRNDPQFKALPVLVVSGKSVTNEKVLGLRLGADDYLGKPFEVQELRARADSLMRRAHDLSQSSYIKKRLWRY